MQLFSSDESKLDPLAGETTLAAAPLDVHGHVRRVLMTIDYPVYRRHRLPAVISATPLLYPAFLLLRSSLFVCIICTAIARTYLLRTPIRSPIKGSHISVDLI